MTSEELAQEIMDAVLAVQGRILGVGQEQYSEGSQQKFELMTLKELVQYAREEVEDGIAYNVMLRYKLNLLDQAIDQAFIGSGASTAPQDKPKVVINHTVSTPLGDSILANYPSAADLLGGVR